MRLIIAAALVVSPMLAAPAQAQGGAFMWCQAAAVKDGKTSHFYSAFFAAAGWQADRKALAFTNELKKAEATGADITAKCMPPADYDAVVAARNAAMKATPGKVLSWEG